MTAAGDAWVRHRMSCERCARWFGAWPDGKMCSTGEKLERQMRRGAERR